MKYLLVLLLISGCISEPTVKQENPEHNLAGEWAFNSSPFTIYQEGNAIHGRQEYNAFLSWDSLIFSGEIIGDSVFINRTFYYHSQPLQFDRVDAKIETDSLMTGVFYGSGLRKNPMYMKRY